MIDIPTGLCPAVFIFGPLIVWFLHVIFWQLIWIAMEQVLHGMEMDSDDFIRKYGSKSLMPAFWKITYIPGFFLYFIVKETVKFILRQIGSYIRLMTN
jgi:hypothetical protein